MPKRANKLPLQSPVAAPSADSKLSQFETNSEKTSDGESKMESTVVPAETGFTLLPISQIVTTFYQPRRYLDPDSLQSLVESIRPVGILQPLLVRPLQIVEAESDLADAITVSGTQMYELVAGERRYQAAKICGLTSVPVIIKDLSEVEAFEYSLMENLQREDLSPIEETDAILQLLAWRLESDVKTVISLLYRFDNETKGKVTERVLGKWERDTILQVFKTLGKLSWQSFVRTRLPLLKLPEDLLEALCAKEIQYTKAREIAKLGDVTERQELLDEVIASGLTLSQIKERISGTKASSKADELQQRLKEIYQQAKKAKVWSKKRKRADLEALLVQIEILLADMV